MTVRYPLVSPHVRERARIDIGAYTPFPNVFHRHPLLRRNGRPYYIAIHILAEILNWYRPIWEEYIDENGQLQVRTWQRFRGEALRLSYAYLADLFGLSEEAIRRAVYFLRDRDLLVMQTVYLQDETGRMEGRAILVYPNWNLIREILDPAGYAGDPDEDEADTGNLPPAGNAPTDRYGHTGREESEGGIEGVADRYGHTGRSAADWYSHTGRSEATEGPKYTGRSSFLAAPTGIPTGTPTGIPTGTAVPPNQNNRDQNRQPKKETKIKAPGALKAAQISHDNFSDVAHESPPPGPKAPSSPEGTAKRDSPAQIMCKSSRKGPGDVAPDGVPDGVAGGGNGPVNVKGPSGALKQPRSPKGPPGDEPGAEVPSGASRDAPQESRGHPDPVPASEGRFPKGVSGSRPLPVADAPPPDGPGRGRGARDAPERVLRDLGVPKKYRRRLAAALRQGEIAVEDLAAELARCYRDAAKGRIERPVLAAVVSLLEDNRAPREFYDPSVWAEHLPEPVWDVLARAGWIPEDADVREADAGEDLFDALMETTWNTEADRPGAPESGSRPPPPGDPEAENLWKKVLRQFRQEMSPASFNTWIRPSRAVAFDGRTLTIAAPNAYAREWLESRLTNGLKRKLVGLLGRQVDVRFVVETEMAGGKRA